MKDVLNRNKQFVKVALYDCSHNKAVALVCCEAVHQPSTVGFR